ncbi:flagellar assembly peptidoglycan hydrolase FlgJ [Melaminivora jejuensis]|uniref:flagellar assembly peptidoglycan hydrolase FlgJ n=1 Tax=Melaminivora jejuensis TaxID=1267217 RepID=UPI001ADFEB9F|nr:flagellar assembly peptidoglycan hydrolase FlgJ [Melaminivora jejuensis]UHJ64651.1 flagellar assembly peptidoglycan hydrolase FlgJ [Melaminivora jejuensis]
MSLSSPSTSLPLAGSTAALATRQALAIDGRSLNNLKAQAAQGAEGQREATREAARQLESLFMRELIKSMREATMKSGLLDGAEGNLASDMMDQQLSVQMAGRSGGLAEAIQRQLARQLGGDADAPALAPGATLRLDTLQRRAAPSRPDNPHAPSPQGKDEFVQGHRAAAETVARESGIPASFMLGQAGHETGWGRSEIRHKDGSNSFNLFGIKAGGSWKGKVAEITTTEYIDGRAQKVTAKFRAYDSYADSFRDYARLITESPRYEKALAKTHSAQAWAAELQKAGYATDPQYASKLSRAIQSTLSVARTPASAASAQA